MEACSNGIGMWFCLPGGQWGSSGVNEGRLPRKRRSANDTDQSGIPQKEVHRQDSSYFSLAKLVVIRWYWLLMLKVSWDIENQTQKISWTFSIEKGRKKWRLPLGFCRGYCRSVSAGGPDRRAEYVPTCCLGAAGGFFHLPDKTLLHGNYQRTSVPSQMS